MRRRKQRRQFEGGTADMVRQQVRKVAGLVPDDFADADGMHAVEAFARATACLLRGLPPDDWAAGAHVDAARNYIIEALLTTLELAQPQQAADRFDYIADVLACARLEVCEGLQGDADA